MFVALENTSCEEGYMLLSVCLCYARVLDQSQIVTTSSLTALRWVRSLATAVKCGLEHCPSTVGCVCACFVSSRCPVYVYQELYVQARAGK